MTYHSTRRNSNIERPSTRTASPADDRDDRGRKRFLLRYYRVWNLEQCELPAKILDKLPKIETHQHDPIEAAERIIAEMPNPPRIQYGGSKAFYSPSTDCITPPQRELFISAEEHFATLAHEAIHYANFRIMPRIDALASTATSRGSEYRHNSVAHFIASRFDAGL
jgi:antirestriction protein ArdC